MLEEVKRVVTRLRNVPFPDKRFQYYGLAWKEHFEGLFEKGAVPYNWPVGDDGKRHPGWDWIFGKRVKVYVSGDVSNSRLGAFMNGLELACNEFNMDISIEYAGRDTYIDHAVSDSGIGTSKYVNLFKTAFGSEVVSALGEKVANANPKYTRPLRRIFGDNFDQVLLDSRKSNHVNSDSLVRRLLSDPRRNLSRGGQLYAQAVITDKILVDDEGMLAGASSFWTGTLVFTAVQSEYEMPALAKHEMTHLLGYDAHHEDMPFRDVPCNMRKDSLEYTACEDCKDALQRFHLGMKRLAHIDVSRKP